MNVDNLGHIGQPYTHPHFGYSLVKFVEQWILLAHIFHDQITRYIELFECFWPHFQVLQLNRSIIVSNRAGRGYVVPHGKQLLILILFLVNGGLQLEVTSVHVLLEEVESLVQLTLEVCSGIFQFNDRLTGVFACFFVPF